MADDKNGADTAALDSLSVAPPDPGAEESGRDRLGAEERGDVHGRIRPPAQDAGQDEGIARRLERDPSNPDAKLDAGLDETMDASDPVAATQPGCGEPAPSSGYDEAHEAALRGERN